MNTPRLKYINLAFNELTSIEKLDQFPLLENLNLSNNKLNNQNKFKCIFQVKSLRNLDLSHNELTLENIEPFFNLHLKCLDLSNNEFKKELVDYRKKMLNGMQSLFWLDNREVKLEERRLVNAWGQGGKEAEKKERDMIKQESKQSYREYVDKIKGPEGHYKS